MIPGTATQLVAVTAAPSAGTASSTGAAQSGEGAFAEALAGAESVLDTADAAVGSSTPVTDVATSGHVESGDSTSASEGGAVQSESSTAVDSSNTHVDASEESETAGGEASESATGNETEVPSDAIAQAVITASTAAVLTSVMARDNAIVTEQSEQVVAVGQSDAIESAIRVATRTMVAQATAEPAIDTDQSVHLPVASDSAADEGTTVPTTAVKHDATQVQTQNVEEPASERASIARTTQMQSATPALQEAEVPEPGDGVTRVNDVSLPKTETATGPNPEGVVPRGRDIAAAAQAAHAARLAARAVPITVNDGSVDSAATSVLPTAATPAAPVQGVTEQVAPIQVNAPSLIASSTDASDQVLVDVDTSARVEPSIVVEGSIDIDQTTSAEPRGEINARITDNAAPDTKVEVAREALSSDVDVSSELSTEVEDASIQPRRIQREASTASAGTETVEVVADDVQVAAEGTRSAVRAGSSRDAGEHAAARGSDARFVRAPENAPAQPAMQSAVPTTQTAQTASQAVGQTGLAVDTTQQQPLRSAQPADSSATAPQMNADAIGGALQAGPEATRLSFEQRSNNLAQLVLSQERIDHIAEQLAMRLKLSHAAGGSEVQLQLRPRELGEVTVQMNVRHGMVTATVVVDRVDTGKLLQTNLDDLRRSLESQGLDVQQFNVDVRGGNAGNPFERMASHGGDSSFARSSGNGGSPADAGGDTNPGLTGDRMVTPDDIHEGNVSVLV